jgi:hypothetical protein
MPVSFGWQVPPPLGANAHASSGPHSALVAQQAGMYVQVPGTTEPATGHHWPFLQAFGFFPLEKRSPQTEAGAPEQTSCEPQSSSNQQAPGVFTGATQKPWRQM